MSKLDIWLQSQQHKNVDIQIPYLLSIRFHLYWTRKALIESFALVGLAIVIGAYL